MCKSEFLRDKQIMIVGTEWKRLVNKATFSMEKCRNA